MACGATTTTAKTVSATIVVDFGAAAGDEDSILVAELDSREDGLNNGKTTFLPGDDVYYFVYKTDNVEIVQHESSAGSIVQQGTVTFVEEGAYVTFEDSDRNSDSKPIEGLSYKWLGKSLGNISVVGQVNYVADSSGVAIAKCNITRTPLVFKLTGVPTKLGGESNYKVLIYIKGKVV